MAEKGKLPRIPVPLSRLEERLVDQLGFLRKSCAAFDTGDTSEYQRIATSLRVLLHDRPPASHALVRQVGLGDIPFISASRPTNPRNLMTEFSLASMALRVDAVGLMPVLDSGPFPPRWVSLKDWWDEKVLRDKHHHHFTRGEIIKVIANQDGGAHVDPALDEAYHRLANEHSIDWTCVGPQGESPLQHVEKVYMRHIAWEAIVSVQKGWDRKQGKRPCVCGSGRKVRYCCEKRPKAA